MYPLSKCDVAGDLRRRRKHISKACDECRRRRAKCDGRRPSCTPCVSRTIDCNYRAEEDGRRPASKAYVELLRNRIDILERTLRSHSIDVDASVTEHASAGHDIKAGTSSSNFQELCASFEGALSLDASLNYDDDGELRYYGPASGRLEFPSCDDTREDSPDDERQHQWATAQPRLQYNHYLNIAEDEVKVPEELKSHLLDLFFTWQNPWCQIVNETLFRESEATQGRYSSPLLLSCIMAMGSRFSDDPQLRTDPEDPNTSGVLFLEKAEVLLYYDLKWPSLTTIQSLSILSIMKVATGSDAGCWLYQGMATRLALDMGFNYDSASLIRSNLMTAAEVDLRKQIYWALYSDDKLLAMYTGRICTMLDSQGVVNLPASSPMEDSNLEISNKASTSNLATLNESLATACRILESIQHALYAPKRLSTESQKISFFDSCILELKTWFYNLPSEMRIDRPTGPSVVPQVYILHMVHYTSFILLIKPFLAEWYRQQSRQDSDELDDAFIKKASTICLESAKRICAVAKKYRQKFGSFRRSPASATHCLLSATLVLIHAENSDGGREMPGTSQLQNIKLCFQALDELSTAWSFARRTRWNLLRLYQQRRNSADIQNPLEASDEGTVSGFGLEKPEGGTFDVSTSPMDMTWIDALLGGNGNVQNATMGHSDIGMLLEESIWTDFNIDYTRESLPSDYNIFDQLSKGNYRNGN
ncbi:fungal-specific transcription factor domain-containing protein [Lipomyces kononenkoae]|uniref:Fungal-specific transcription factor domain-containing protein n=1 Tax=Lipomyces kononenkoae TaxID=34357 RepID=A0ACC3SUI5_LIPKO